MSAMRTVRDLHGVLLVESGPAPLVLLAQIPWARSYTIERYVRLGALSAELQEQIQSQVVGIPKAGHRGVG